MKDTIECPYCGEYTDEPDESYEEDENYEVNCKHCDKYFFASPYYLKCWNDAKKAPCLNGGDHDYVHEITAYGDKVRKYKECECGKKLLVSEID